MNNIQLVSTGQFGLSLAALLQPWAERADAGAGLHVYCASALNLQSFQEYGRQLAGDQRLLGVFLFERFLFITPVLSNGDGPCAACYVARLLSHPPQPLNDFVVRAAVRICDENLKFAYHNWNRSTLQLAAELVQQQIAAGRANQALALDIGGLNILADRVLPLHACACRQAGIPAARIGARRFVAFVPELQACLAGATTKQGAAA
ncbi:hypothetical protein RugamoR64_55750 [Duganella rhizosphaerae]|uniref:hypothetical protein n=1 Tax=Duganella rhizosphaerae TaxID=2885763 RepID=UPI0030E98550